MLEAFSPWLVSLNDNFHFLAPLLIVGFMIWAVASTAHGKFIASTALIALMFLVALYY